ncbi:MAG TPA: hypothetical protein VHB30_08280, partial [Solirubrobacteraceae bacterium]|nr:hypothetical protein [Solirubrobacteraceae bacterium]
LACFGEVGLTGEVRPVAHADRRAAEARKFGLAELVAPDSAPTLRDAVRAALGGRSVAPPESAELPEIRVKTG